MGSLWQDVRFGVRLLVSQPQFTAVAAIILALGVGTPTAVFSVVNAALVRPLPYQDPGRLVAITSVFQAPNRADVPARTVALTEVGAWQRSARHLSSLGAFAYTEIPVRVGDQALSLVTALVDPAFLPTLGVPLAAGSHFPAGPEAERTVIISHRLWTTAFEGDPGAVGRTLLVDGTPHVLRGILRADFQFARSDASYSPRPVDLLLPPSSVPGFTPQSRQWWGIGRLAAGATAADAEAELRAIAEAEREAAPAAGAWSPLTFGAAAAAAVLATLAASYGPAYRASRLEPLAALRHE